MKRKIKESLAFLPTLSSLSNRKTKQTLISLGFLAPSIIAVFIFVYGFIARTIQVSFLNWNTFAKLLQGKKNYIGLKNYINLFQDPRFQTDLWNTLYFTLFFILGCLFVGILLSVLVDNIPKGAYFFQNLYLYPFALSFVVTGTVWRWITAPGNLPDNPYGLNLLLENLGLSNLQWGWFTSTTNLFGFNIALIPVLIAAIWQFSGYTMAMWLAGLKGVPQQLIEAARIDGASKWQIFTKILFPMLRPVTLSAIIVLAHISLKAFALIYSMTGSGPSNVTDIPAVYMFEATFQANRYSAGASIAIILLALVGVLIIPYLIYNYNRGEN
ncbi:permease component of ABC-type sugar transporter [Halobacteroides halobius DSM 5150]|uniref:Permease component of ABC-type sugar transporter n=1 Tax=Halobacteroides halobius (strain ATCC 35273 / DSM 5150 / MD-1) TaxID=748449 RepID=L0K7K3_HALHC|nr:sugar ABC transporter permease [Halobacteroides halobius]AGB41267.1 permease component of ABC-type sugar transporter [Halobacteroides halobius DSM 5150]